jgi:heme-degrading monooxygenase HmoA
MYVAIRRYENNAQLADRLVARRDEIQAVISEVAGFRAYYLLRSSDGTTSVTSSL